MRAFALNKLWCPFTESFAFFTTLFFLGAYGERLYFATVFFWSGIRGHDCVLLISHYSIIISGELSCACASRARCTWCLCSTLSTLCPPFALHVILPAVGRTCSIFSFYCCPNQLNISILRCFSLRQNASFIVDVNNNGGSLASIYDCDTESKLIEIHAVKHLPRCHRSPHDTIKCHFMFTFIIRKSIVFMSNYSFLLFSFVASTPFLLSWIVFVFRAFATFTLPYRVRRECLDDYYAWRISTDKRKYLLWYWIMYGQFDWCMEHASRLFPVIGKMATDNSRINDRNNRSKMRNTLKSIFHFRWKHFNYHNRNAAAGKHPKRLL